jgi:DMSO/TMAO reductase YedYZ molybdopterin-dependent catalytic subunit
MVDSDDIHRRTGRLPINAETPSEILLSHEVTPVENFYVRCHGDEPRLDGDTHSLDVCLEGEVVRQLTMSQLRQEFVCKSIRMTLVCDGNRRKELNTIRRTNGFDWGCCAVSTGIFGGAPLIDILLRFFEKDQLASHHHVVFESADKLERGHYATSIPLAAVLGGDYDVLVAYKLNGQDLTREHGFPVRTVIPGNAVFVVRARSNKGACRKAPQADIRNVLLKIVHVL